MDINLEYYKIFYYTARTGRITDAARELNISQPAVSQAIKHLEDSLGARLFIRNPRGVSLTEAGNVLMDYVSSGYETIKSGERKVDSLKELEYGELNIGASDMTLQYFLLPFLEEYSRLYPNIKIHITNAPTPLTMSHLFRGTIDFGAVSGPIESDPRLHIKKVREIEDIFIAGPSYIELKDKILNYKDLEKYPIIMLEEGTSSTRRYTDSFLASKGVSLTPEFQLATSNMIVQFAAQNLGIGCVVEDFAKRHISDGRVIKLSFRSRIPRRNICIITDRRHDVSSAASGLLRLIDSASAP